MSNVVVLNRNYEYWCESSLKKVLKWVAAGKVEIISADESLEVGSIEFRINLPFVVRLLKFIGYKPKTEEVKYSPEAVFNRDNNNCQYWHFDKTGKRFQYKCSDKERTIDHVIPLSRKGSRGFLNEVCACKTCNTVTKKNKTPEEAGLILIRKPFIPRRDKNSFVIRRFSFSDKKVAHKKYYTEILGFSV